MFFPRSETLSFLSRLTQPDALARLLAAALLPLALAGASSAATPAGPYLGQTPPGETPVVFAPGVISRGNIHSRLVISPDSREMFWNTVDMATFSTQILSVRSVDGTWTSPEAPPFTRGGNTQGALFSPDGTKLHFWIDSGEGWAARSVERTEGGWSSPQGGGIAPPSSSSFTRSGEVFYSAELKSKVWGSGIFAGRYTAEGILEGRPLGPRINVENAIDYTPFVSPDGSFLLFSSNRPTLGDQEDMHLHVTFRAGDGEWSTPVRVLDIEGRFPSLSPDGKYLFFCGDDGNIYWVAASILESLRPPGATRPEKAAPTT